jgi:hypothetical protein
MVPLTAIFQQGDQAAVWIVGADATVKLQAVSVAEYTDGGAVVSAGLRRRRADRRRGRQSAHGRREGRVAPVVPAK